MNILVVDGQGGGMGRCLVEQIKLGLPDETVIAVGTNSLATSAMLKAGADAGATGENAVIFNARRADIITGPLGVVIANSMMGELSPKMAQAIGESDATKILIPVKRCKTTVVGTQARTASEYIEDAVRMIAGICEAALRPARRI